MHYRYAILWEHNGDDTRPATLVLQRDRDVYVDAPNELCIPASFSDGFVVGSVNGPFPITYTPADPQYFDQVLIELSRTFSIGDQGTVDSASSGTILRLLNEKIVKPLQDHHQEPYTTAHRYTAVREYQATHWGANPSHDERPAAAAAEDSLVAV